MIRYITLIVIISVIGIAYGADTQFHLLSERGNTFILQPPDLPRPANIISETAHLIVRNPPSGMFVMTAQNGTTTKFTPLQSGLDVSGFGGGTVRVIYGTQWESADEHTFRDQPFGYMTGSPMYQSSAMPLYAGYNATYTWVPLLSDSRFGLDPVVYATNNTLGLTAGPHGEYRLNMGHRDRAGLDFGPRTATDHTYYIYRGCTTCKTEVVAGYGNPANGISALPNGPTADHPRGWRSTGDCTTTYSTDWSGATTRPISTSYVIPPPAHSNAGDYTIPNRYDDLSILPGAHSVCTGTLYTESAEDNRKHDMCVTGSAATATTTYSYPYTTTTTTHIIVNGTITGNSTTTTQTGTVERQVVGSCTPPTPSQTPDGYRVVSSCTGGPAPSNPPRDSITSTATSRTVTTYGTPSVVTDANIQAACSLTTNTPHLDLADAMTIQPGLNIYRPPTSPTPDHLLIIYDDTEQGGGSHETIQVYRTSGFGKEPAGPYNFHLHPPVSGIIYDAHTHYGWITTRLYNTTHLADMGYTPYDTLAYLADGMNIHGIRPYQDGTRLCHGDCYMGPAAVDTIRPSIRELTPDAIQTVTPYTGGLVYDHINEKWFDSGLTGTDGQIVVSSLYLVVPFSVEVALLHIRMYDEHFDPIMQAPSPRVVAAGTLPCHISQSGQVYEFASTHTIPAGGRLMIPVLPEMKYVAFIGGGDCYWYDVSSLPSPLASVSSGARSVPLVNGTVLTGELVARHTGPVAVDVITDIDAVWQSELYGMTQFAGPYNVSWVVPPLEVNVTAIARVNGADGACGAYGVYCSDIIRLHNTTIQYGTYIHGGPTGIHGQPYGVAPNAFTGITYAGTGVYGMANGRCYGLASVIGSTDGITVRGIPNIQVSAGDSITLAFNVTMREPHIQNGTVGMPVVGNCGMVQSIQSATLDIRTMTATLR